MFIRKFLFYIYIFFILLSLLIYYIIKCKYNNDFFDKFLYIDKGNQIIGNNIYYNLLNILIYFIYGIIFGKRNFIFMILKIILFQFIILYIQNCNLLEYEIKYEIKYYYLIKSIITSIVFYYLGTLLSDYFYNNLLNFDNKFNFSLKFTKIKK